MSEVGEGVVDKNQTALHDLKEFTPRIYPAIKEQLERFSGGVELFVTRSDYLLKRLRRHKG